MSVEIKIAFYNAELTNYNPKYKAINLGSDFIGAEKLFSDSEFNQYISDTITHEFIHYLLHKEFNNTISKLFDAIEHNIGNYKLKKRLFKYIAKNNNSEYPKTWLECIKIEGLQAFFDCYDIEPQEVKNSSIACNKRSV